MTHVSQVIGEKALRRLSKPPRILIVEDEAEVRAYLEVALDSMGYRVDTAQDGEEALACLRAEGEDYDLLLLDLIMPVKDGFETLREVRQFDTALPIIVLSGASSPLMIVDAIKSGANDFLAKPANHEDLRKAIEGALKVRYSEETAPEAPEQPAADGDAYVVSSSWTKKLEVFLAQVGSADVPVLLQGETGVGKEVLARQIHAGSARSKKPFLKLNCAALPSELVESELFGYERGAFTGAFRNNPGRFELADGGTMLLDEIGDMDFKLQAKLLQVLQDGEFQRLGGKETCKVDVRVIAATHCDLELAISEGRFREDLYYRLNIIRIEVPPLRERKEEILPLARYFLNKHALSGQTPPEITPLLRQALVAHSWPGNVRELENVIRKVIVLRNPDMIVEELRRSDARRQSLQATRSGKHPRAQPIDAGGRDGMSALSPDFSPEMDAGEGHAGDSSDLRKVDEARKLGELEAIMGALQATRWNRKQAAALLKIDYKALLYKMKKLGIGERTVGSVAS